MTTIFTDVFLANSPVTETLMSFFSAKDAMNLGHMCKNIFNVVHAHLSEKKVIELADKILELPLEKLFSLQTTPEKCKKNWFFVQCAVRRNGLDIQFADKDETGRDLKRDLFILKTALFSTKFFNPEKYTELRTFLDADLLERPDVRLIENISLPPSMLSKNMWNKYGFFWLMDRPPYNRDKDIILAAIRAGISDFLSSNAELQANRDIILTAAAEYEGVLEYASPELRADRDIVLAAAPLDRFALREAAPQLRSDRQLVLTAVRSWAGAFAYADPALQSDKDFVLAAVQLNGEALEYADPVIRSNKEVVLAAIKQNVRAFAYASAGLKVDKDILAAAFNRHQKAEDCSRSLRPRNT